MRVPVRESIEIYKQEFEELGAPKPINFEWAIDKVKQLRKEFAHVETLDGYDLACMEYDFDALKNNV